MMTNVASHTTQTSQSQAQHFANHEIRCYICNKLLAKSSAKVEKLGIEIKCSRCRTIIEV
jgi:hypothetical protein